MADTAARSAQWRAAEQFLVDGLRDLRLDAVPLRADVGFEDPLSGGVVSGAAAVAEYLRAHQTWLRDVYADGSLEEPGQVAIRGRLELRAGGFEPYVTWFDFEQGTIAAVRMYWDPRAVLR